MVKVEEPTIVALRMDESGMVAPDNEKKLKRKAGKEGTQHYSNIIFPQF